MSREQEALEHQRAFMAWRHALGNPKTGVGRILPQDLGYDIEDRAHCPHCKDTQK